MKMNNSNDFAKRNANTVNSILKSNGIEFKAQNTGDGRLFHIQNNDFKTRFLLKKAGFLLQRCKEDDKNCYFSCF